MPVNVRLFAPGDAPTVVGLYRRAAPHEVVTEESLLWSWRAFPAENRIRWLVAEVGGRPVGYARARLLLPPDQPVSGLVSHLMVDPGHMDSGAAQALLDAGEEHLRSHGAGTVRAMADGERLQRVLREQGYALRSSYRLSRLDLAVLPPLPERPEGVDLRPLSEYAEDPRPVFEVDAATTEDEPDDVPLALPSFAHWKRTVWQDPVKDLELSVLARVDGVPAALVAFASDRRSRLWSDMTGTLRAHRGRGIARYAKAAALHRARERGFTTAFAGNDDTNGPMLAINTWLGYRPDGGGGVYSRDR